MSHGATSGACISIGSTPPSTAAPWGPARRQARWVWLTPGSVLAAVLWLLLTIGFGIYVANFGNYGATYGSLSAVVVLLTWLYLSSYILLFGAELNAEREPGTRPILQYAVIMDVAGASMRNFVRINFDNPRLPGSRCASVEPRHAGLLYA